MKFSHVVRLSVFFTKLMKAKAFYFTHIFFYFVSRYCLYLVVVGGVPPGLVQGSTQGGYVAK